MAEKIKAVIFDMDGVLIDAKDWHYEALNRALALFGMEISRYDHLVTYDGLPTRKKLQMLTMERGLPEGLHEFINEMKQIYTLEIVYAKCKPVFQHQYALSRLRAAGYRMAVCSNSVQPTMQLMLEKASLLDFIEFHLSNQDVQKPKPDPEMYEAAIRRLRLQARECLVVEDNDHGIRAATAAGTHVLAVNGVADVTYANIVRRIGEIESRAPAEVVHG